jgi:hypothetical protein
MKSDFIFGMSVATSTILLELLLRGGRLKVFPVLAHLWPVAEVVLGRFNLLLALELVNMGDDPG